jgi:hypothetical protein
MRHPTTARRSRPRPVTSYVVLGVSLGALVGCTGVISGEEGGSGPGSLSGPTNVDDPGGTPTNPGDVGAGATCDKTAKSFAPARLWQLTDEQYVNVVRDVLGVALEGSDAQIISAAVPDRYTNYSEGSFIGLQVAPSYQLAATKVASRVVAKAATLFGAANPSVEQVQTFLNTKIARAWRRPLSEKEVTALTKLYSDALPDANVGMSLVMQAALQAPSFLYRTEIGTNAAAATELVPLTPYEMASALSFMMLESAPDETLWAHAIDGTIAQPAGLAAEVERLLVSPAAQRVLTRKASYWLGLEALHQKAKDQKIYPEFTPALKDSLYASAQAFLGQTLWQGKLSDLFSSTTVYADTTLAAVYGLGNVAASGLTAVQAPERNAGILTQPGFLAAANKWGDRGDPIHRGLFVYDSFICGGKLPPPPADAFAIGSAQSGSEREKVQKRAGLSCRACHSSFDPIGLAFERYDSIGRYSETKYVEFDPVTGLSAWKTSAGSIDASAVLPDQLGERFAGAVSGVGELAKKLANAGDVVASCAAKQLVEYSLGYNPEAQNSCELEAVKKRFAESGSFVEFFRALATSPAFAVRDPAPK